MNDEILNYISSTGNSATNQSFKPPRLKTFSKPKSFNAFPAKAALPPDAQYNITVFSVSKPSKPFGLTSFV